MFHAIAGEFFHILDVGANVGQWATDASERWPLASITMVEANPGCEPQLCKLGFPYRIALVGSEEKESVPFYKIGDSDTGASVYRELTDIYKDCRPTTLPQTTLDNLFPDWSFDLIKLDTQGSELDILRGADKLRSRAESILMEVSNSPYNDGAPLASDVIEYMHTIGFINWLDCGRNHVNQSDIIFWR